MSSPQPFNEKKEEDVFKMRRIGEKKEVPKNKDQLIDYLLDRLGTVENAIDDTQNVLEKEREENEKLATDLEEKTLELEEIKEKQKSLIKETVQNKIGDSITQATEAKNVALQKVEEKQNLLAEKDALIIKLEEQLSKKKIKKTEFKSNYLNLNQDNKILEEELNKSQERNERLQKDNGEKATQIQKLESELIELKEVIGQLNLAKNTLNKYLSSSPQKATREELNDSMEEVDFERAPEKAKKPISKTQGGGVQGKKQSEKKTTNARMNKNNNDYFYGNQPEIPNVSAEPDDDFWYASPSPGGPIENVGIAPAKGTKSPPRKQWQKQQ